VLARDCNDRVCHGDSRREDGDQAEQRRIVRSPHTNDTNRFTKSDNQSSAENRLNSSSELVSVRSKLEQLADRLFNFGERLFRTATRLSCNAGGEPILFGCEILGPEVQDLCAQVRGRLKP